MLPGEGKGGGKLCARSRAREDTQGVSDTLSGACRRPPVSEAPRDPGGESEESLGPAGGVLTQGRADVIQGETAWVPLVLAAPARISKSMQTPHFLSFSF